MSTRPMRLLDQESNLSQHFRMRAEAAEFIFWHPHLTREELYVPVAKIFKTHPNYVERLFRTWEKQGGVRIGSDRAYFRPVLPPRHYPHFLDIKSESDDPFEW